ncbi:glycerophosphodiester phosphodiesterase family protein [Pararhodonellum marinum]|uniref:glycerophosphodiester phosphodiesterase family protein n=1 Tax=Pararhodonellum marinum TaxID=2755358 RepID=UPI00188FD047|nr:glycerophosphodiester phosphodiesterase family protein [Pararhodonellum marinum]
MNWILQTHIILLTALPRSYRKNSLLLTLFSLTSIGVFGQSLPEKILQDKLIVCSHRGVPTPDFPENSIAAMKISKEKGLLMHEIDLMESADGELYLLHDLTLDRTTTHSGLISDLQSSDLDSVMLLDNNEPLPRFDKVLDWAKANEVYLMLDVKQAPLKKVVGEVKKAEMLQQVMVLTFTETRAREAFELESDFLVSVLIEKAEDIDNYLCAMEDPNYLLAYLNKDAPLDLYEKVQKTGLPIITDVMGTIDQEALEKGIEVYLDFIQNRSPRILVSDYPLSLISALEKIQ